MSGSDPDMSEVDVSKRQSALGKGAKSASRPLGLSFPDMSGSDPGRGSGGRRKKRRSRHLTERICMNSQTAAAPATASTIATIQ
jgi:hypothetical protein